MLQLGTTIPAWFFWGMQNKPTGVIKTEMILVKIKKRTAFFFKLSDSFYYFILFLFKQVGQDWTHREMENKNAMTLHNQNMHHIYTAPFTKLE